MKTALLAAVALSTFAFSSAFALPATVEVSKLVGSHSPVLGNPDRCLVTIERKDTSDLLPEKLIVTVDDAGFAMTYELYAFQVTHAARHLETAPEYDTTSVSFNRVTRGTYGVGKWDSMSLTLTFLVTNEETTLFGVNITQRNNEEFFMHHADITSTSCFSLSSNR